MNKLVPIEYTDAQLSAGVAHLRAVRDQGGSDESIVGVIYDGMLANAPPTQSKEPVENLIQSQLNTAWSALQAIIDCPAVSEDAGKLKLIAIDAMTRYEPAQPQEPNRPASGAVDEREVRELLLDHLSDILDAKQVMFKAGIEQSDFPTMFAQFSALSRAQQAPVVSDEQRQAAKDNALKAAENACQSVIDSGDYDGHQQYAAAACRNAIRAMQGQQAPVSEQKDRK